MTKLELYRELSRLGTPEKFVVPPSGGEHVQDSSATTNEDFIYWLVVGVRVFATGTHSANR